jgi:Nucleotidyl transferase AbiEii toxin, Type IV TA system
MDPFHERLARVALDVAASYGFALAGGYAVQAHGFLDRPSADVDLFAEASAQFDFSEAVNAVIAAYRRDGLEADAEVRSSFILGHYLRISVPHSFPESAGIPIGIRISCRIGVATGVVGNRSTWRADESSWRNLAIFQLVGETAPASARRAAGHAIAPAAAWSPPPVARRYGFRCAPQAAA